MNESKKQKVIFTLVKNDKETNSDLFFADASAVARSIFGDGRYAHVKVAEGEVYVTKGSRRNYDKFARLIESAYPGMCKFDYKVK